MKRIIKLLSIMGISTALFLLSGANTLKAHTLEGIHLTMELGNRGYVISNPPFSDKIADGSILPLANGLKTNWLLGGKLAYCFAMDDNFLLTPLFSVEYSNNLHFIADDNGGEITEYFIYGRLNRFIFGLALEMGYHWDRWIINFNLGAKFHDNMGNTSRLSKNIVKAIEDGFRKEFGDYLLSTVGLSYGFNVNYRLTSITSLGVFFEMNNFFPTNDLKNFAKKALEDKSISDNGRKMFNFLLKGLAFFNVGLRLSVRMGK